MSVLIVQSSGRGDSGSTTQVIQMIAERIPHTVKTIRHTPTLPYVDKAFIDECYGSLSESTRNEQENENQDDNVCELSKICCQEIKQADYIIIACPVYNFFIPASLKAWIDLVVIIGSTYHYTSDGPQGLLNDKKRSVYLVCASGGLEIGSGFDFGTKYMQHVFKFLGLSNIVVIPVSDTMEDTIRCIEDKIVID
jgi:FMN-dependent NADH-azoreductase